MLRRGSQSRPQPRCNQSPTEMGGGGVFLRVAARATVQPLSFRGCTVARARNNPRWHPLFSEADIERARARLCEYGYMAV